jgi:hypothetical protein
MSMSHQIGSLICLASALLFFAIDAVVNSFVFHCTAFQKLSDWIHGEVCHRVLPGVWMVIRE